jgi:hypothetical protein
MHDLNYGKDYQYAHDIEGNLDLFIKQRLSDQRERTQRHAPQAHLPVTASHCTA